MPTSYDALAIFLFFLPGIIGTVLFQSGAEAKKPSNFDKVAVAITIALLSSVLADRIFGVPFLGTAKSTNIADLIKSYSGIDALWRTLVACALGVLFAVIHNKGWLYALLRRITFTHRTGKIDVWHQAFTSHRFKWVRIRLKDDSQLVGWVKWYSMTNENRDLFVADATWHSPLGTTGSVKTDVDGAGVLVSNFDEIIGIEFLD